MVWIRWTSRPCCRSATHGHKPILPDRSSPYAHDPCMQQETQAFGSKRWSKSWGSNRIWRAFDHERRWTHGQDANRLCLVQVWSPVTQVTLDSVSPDCVYRRQVYLDDGEAGAVGTLVEHDVTGWHGNQ
jgi:hypothetical protein